MFTGILPQLKIFKIKHLKRSKLKKKKKKTSDTANTLQPAGITKTDWQPTGKDQQTDVQLEYKTGKGTTSPRSL